MTVLNYMVFWDYPKKKELEKDIEFLEQHNFKSHCLNKIIQLFPVTKYVESTSRDFYNSIDA